MGKRVRVWLLLAVIVCSLGAWAQEPAGLTFYVAPNGRDAWSGTLDTPNAGGTDGPFATLEGARDALRKIPAKTQPITVQLRQGYYLLERPFALGPQDSGTAAAPISYAAYPGEQPVISGGRFITGWRQATVNGLPAWAVDIPAVREGKWTFRELWVNGQRRTRARYPAAGFLRVAALPDATPDTPYSKGQKRFQYNPGEIPHWTPNEDVEAVFLHYWVSARIPVAGVDEQQRIVSLHYPTRRNLTESVNTGMARYYLENAIEFLTAPGEWYLDRKAGTLYYLPMPGEDMTTARVIAPWLTTLLTMDGKPDAQQFVEHVRFQHLFFGFTNWEPTDNSDVQAASNIPGAFFAVGARQCRLEHCTVAHTGTYGLELARGCSNNAVVACAFTDLGAGGVKFGTVTKADSDISNTNTLSDSQLFDGGKVFYQGSGIWVGQSHHNLIENNAVYGFNHSGISVGWQWEYGPSGAHDNMVRNNDVYNIGQGLLNDMGGIYTLGEQPGTVIRHNRVRDVNSFSFGGWGLYFDGASSYIHAEDNLIYRCWTGPFEHDYGRDDLLRNNIFALGRVAELSRSREEEHPSFTFEHNIVYYREGQLLGYNWRNGKFSMDYNLYWNPTGAPITFGGQSLAQWRAKGKDLHSQLADPGFLDPEHENFILRPDSPALALGFKPFEMSFGPKNGIPGCGYMQ